MVPFKIIPVYFWNDLVCMERWQTPSSRASFEFWEQKKVVGLIAMLQLVTKSRIVNDVWAGELSWSNIGTGLFHKLQVVFFVLLFTKVHNFKVIFLIVRKTFLKEPTMLHANIVYENRKYSTKINALFWVLAFLGASNRMAELWFRPHNNKLIFLTTSYSFGQV